MRKIFAILASLTLLTFSVQPSFADSPIGSRPMIKIKDSTSLNWSGYASLTSLTHPLLDSVSDVKGSWTVPTMNCSATSSAHTYSSTWVGIDGYSDNTVEQTGTEDDCVGPTQQHSVWYEMYPKFPVTVSLPGGVKAGDSITAEVAFTGRDTFTLTLTDTSTGHGFRTTQKSTGKRESAEWIVEAPSSSGGVLPLANFQAVSLSNLSATINGHTGGVNAFANDPLTMTTSTGAIKAQPVNLSSDGSSFQVNWLSQ